MDFEPEHWGNSGGTASLCLIEKLAEWIEAKPTEGDLDRTGPHVAAIFLADADTATEAYLGQYRGRLLLAKFDLAAKRATHLAFYPVIEDEIEIKKALASLIGAVGRYKG